MSERSVPVIIDEQAGTATFGPPFSTTVALYQPSGAEVDAMAGKIAQGIEDEFLATFEKHLAEACAEAVRATLSQDASLTVANLDRAADALREPPAPSWDGDDPPFPGGRR